MTTVKEFQARVKHYERERGLSFRGAMQAALTEFIVAARADEREHCLTLIECSIPSLRALAPTLKDPKVATVHANALEEAGKAVRESGRFRDALETQKSQGSGGSK